jgi:pimeloyl-ACP methyl ester carboxylesterase
MPEENLVILKNEDITLESALKKGAPGPAPQLSTPTAILVVHGIGDQLPLETLDDFGRGLVSEYKALYPDLKIRLEHIVATKSGDDGSHWFENVVRVHLGDLKYIDLYEYYWANYTQDLASFNDIRRWLNGVVAGSKKFYDKIAALDEKFSGGGPFFNKKGKFMAWKYSLFLKSVTYIFPLVQTILKAILWALSFIPVLGKALQNYFQSFYKDAESNLSNVVGDIVVYNVSDPKSKYYCVRRQILDGAVSALTYLIEKTDIAEQTTSLSYPSVIMAGHSLGSQVSFDAINKLNLLVNKGLIRNYDDTGACMLNGHPGRKISSQLKGYITFGSPLDKIAFFLREMVADEKYIRQQLLDNYHGFKQKDWSQESHILHSKLPYEYLQNPLNRLFDDIPWRNYYDKRDYVSGSLDYYDKLTNIDCGFESNWRGFTHSYYWSCPGFYRDIIQQYLN